MSSNAITIADIRRLVSKIAEDAGLPAEVWTKTPEGTRANIGALVVDVNQGRYALGQMINDGDGEGSPMGNGIRCYTKQEFYSRLIELRALVFERIARAEQFERLAEMLAQAADNNPALDAQVVRVAIDQARAHAKSIRDPIKIARAPH